LLLASLTKSSDVAENVVEHFAHFTLILEKQLTERN